MKIALLGLIVASGCGSAADDTHSMHHDHGDSTLPEDFDDSTEKTTASGILVAYSTAPNPPVESEEFSVILSHSGGTIVAVDAAMPTHGGHGMNVTPRLEDDGTGTVVVSPFQFHMPGYWEMVVDLENDAGQEEQVRFDMACCG